MLGNTGDRNALERADGFLNVANSYLIDFRLGVRAPDTDVEIFAGHQWAEPDVDHLRTLMRHVFTSRGSKREGAGWPQGDGREI